LAADAERRYDQIEVPDFRGMQAPNASIAGHDARILLAWADPDSPQPLLHGIVAAQAPRPASVLYGWDIVTVWLRDVSGPRGVPEPLRPPPRFRPQPAWLQAA
jgi:hypothetical protein